MSNAKEFEMKAIKCYLTDEQDAIIRKQAYKNNLSLSAYIRKVFTQYSDVGSMKRKYDKLEKRINAIERNNLLK